jgi:hypothetical protein
MLIPRHPSHIAANILGTAFEDKIMEYIFATSQRRTVKCCCMPVSLVISDVGIVSY